MLKVLFVFISFVVAISLASHNGPPHLSRSTNHGVVEKHTHTKHHIIPFESSENIQHAKVKHTLHNHKNGHHSRNQRKMKSTHNQKPQSLNKNHAKNRKQIHEHSQKHHNKDRRYKH